MIDDRRYRAISQGFAELVKDLPSLAPFDVVIVGSGYGAAAAAWTFATRRNQTGDPVSVCVLERGNEYLPGMFPARFAELPAHLRFSLPGASRNHEGLFDIRFSPSVTTVVANGVGGGSLINAGVMERPADTLFNRGWPEGLDAGALARYFDAAESLLGADFFDGTRPDADLPAKYRLLRALDPSHHRPARITVAQQDQTSSGGFTMSRCIECGDCATGCNHNAKISLDVSLLGRAARQPNCSVYTGATVLSVEPVNGQWRVNCVHTDGNLRKRQGSVIPVAARHVVLSAGTLGSVEILKRSTCIPVSSQLGERASTNGDMIVVDYDGDPVVNAVADETVAPAGRGVGPTITSVIDWRDDPNKPSLVIEDMAVPASLRRIFRDLYATVAAVHGIGDGDCSRHRRGFPEHDIYAVDDRPLRHTTLYAVMGDDQVDGATVRARVEVPEGSDADYRDGVAVLASDDVAASGLFRQQVQGVEQLTRTTGGRVIPNPAWRLLPGKLQWLMGPRHGPLVTVHPLGGCAMADSRERGVVDTMGRVFDAGAAAENAVHPGLAVLDGSVIPTALGTNPALTITALALQGAERLADEWSFTSPADSEPSTETRSRYRSVDGAFAVEPTEVRVVERLSGLVRFRALGERYPRTQLVELTLAFRSVDLDRLMRTTTGAGTPGSEPRLTLDPEHSRLRVLEPNDWKHLQRVNLPEPMLERSIDLAARLNVPVTGSLTLFERQASVGFWRVMRAGFAWLINRGLRDIWQGIGKPAHPEDPGAWHKLKAMLAVASRAGEKRALRYQIYIGTSSGSLALRADRLEGIKTFTYGLRANPWNQLMEVRLLKFPGMGRWSRPRTLRVDLPFFVRRGIPLFHITRQQDASTGLADLAAFAAYIVRLMVGIHLWSFRKPDDDPRTDAEIRRLPQDIPGLPGREVHEIPIGQDVVRLTRYPAPASAHPPLLMIHGYSIGGTTYAHPVVEPNAARYFHGKDRDVWIIDMRTSPGMASATRAWRFEDIAMIDIPLAVARILKETNATKVDVLAHCMGAAMFSMAVLRDTAGEQVAEDAGPEVADALEKLPCAINRVVLSQIAPLMMLSPANRFRGYVVRYLLDFLPLDDYRFRPLDPESVGNQLLDRLLSSLPYPRREFFHENPLAFWRTTPWVRTRHRMDVLYGRDFEVRNMPAEVLAHLDDFCGPMSLQTVSQTLHFAHLHTIADHGGRNSYVTRSRIERWCFETLGIHSADNALADVKTVYRMQDVFAGALGRRFRHHIVPHAGHLDWLIGTPQVAVFDRIRDFLDGPASGPARTPQDGYVVYPPWIGPILSTIERNGAPDRVFVRVGSRPSLSEALGVIFLPRNPGTPPDVITDMVLVVSNELNTEHWATVEVPETAMPGPGGSLLVLIVYPEVEGISLLGLEEGQYAEFNLRLEGWEADAFQLEEGDRVEEPSFSFDLERLGNLLAAIQVARDIPPLPVSSRLDQIAPPELTSPGNRQRAAIAHAVNDTLAGPPSLLVDGLVEYDSGDRDERVTQFALGSCQLLPSLIDEPVAGTSYGCLLERIRRQPATGVIRPRFVVLTGDQVYTDIRAGLYDPTQQDSRFAGPYERWLRLRAVRDVFRHVPSVMLLDDHELDDNWEPIAPGAPMEAIHDALRADGIEAYRKYQRPSVPTPSTVWYTTTLKGARLFLMDTRTNRTRRTAGTLDDAATALVDPPQWTALLQWLNDHADEPKFVVAPPMLFPRLLRIAAPGAAASEALHSDRWDGYPQTLRSLIGALADAAKPIRNLVFLSGDEHRACLAEVVVRKGGQTTCRFRCVHTPGTHAPFPSGNALPARFRHAETFSFDGYDCEITAEFPGNGENGFTYLSLDPAQGGGWSMGIEYDEGAPRNLLLWNG